MTWVPRLQRARLLEQGECVHSMVATVKLVRSTQPLLTEDGIFSFILQECDWCQVTCLEANHGRANLGRGTRKSQYAVTDPFEENFAKLGGAGTRTATSKRPQVLLSRDLAV